LERKVLKAKINQQSIIVQNKPSEKGEVLSV